MSLTKFSLWAGSCIVSLCMGCLLGDFSWDDTIKTGAKLEEFITNDGRKAITLVVPTVNDRRYSEDNFYTFLETSSGKYQTALGTIDSLSKSISQPDNLNARIVNEYIDTNTNGLYDSYRLVVERGTQRDVVKSISLGTELEENEFNRFYPRIENQRFLAK